MHLAPCALLGKPAAVWMETDAGWRPLTAGVENEWGDATSRFFLRPTTDEGLAAELEAPHDAVRRIRVRWRCRLPGRRFLGDHWERGYGDLEWRGRVPERVMPWSVLAWDGTITRGLGVRTGAAALCHWRVDGEGVEWWLDVRCGGLGVRLGPRRLPAATALAFEGTADQSPFAAARAFCRGLCSAPLRPAAPVLGGNDWYYAYGRSSADESIANAARMADLAADAGTTPFMVIDDGWQIAHNDQMNGGPWHAGNGRFPDMAGLAAAMRRAGARPGLWFRPLLTSADVPESWLQPAACLDHRSKRRLLDPSVPEVLAQIEADVRRFRDWGFELIKHDFTSYDVTRRWGFRWGADITDTGWAFADRGRTTAEILRALYARIHDAADGLLTIGCNTIGHLAAGCVELQRTGDDTSGREWERTRRMGVNTLAFRLPQHDAFFAADADCVAVTDSVPWPLTARWLDLVARSGTPLFVSVQPAACGPVQRAALRAAFARAARPEPDVEPLDWLDTTCPQEWRFGAETVRYDWMDDGAGRPGDAG